MPALVTLLIFAALLALVLALGLVLPGLAGIAPEIVALFGAALLAAFVLAQLLGIARRLDGRLRGLESTVNRLMREVEDGREARTASGERSEEMVREMRVLQTLLGQLAGRSAAKARDEAEERGAADAGRGHAAAARRNSRPEHRGDLLGIVRNALSENRIDLYLQPTVALPSRRTAHYECFSRVRDDAGQVIYPTEFLPLAESSGLVGSLDNLLLFRCIQLVRKLGARRPAVRFFCNIAPGSLADDQFFPQFVDYMLANHEFAERLVFEFAADEFASLSRATRLQLGTLGAGGYRFGLDRAGEASLDPAELFDAHVAFLKVDADRLGGGEGRRLRRELAAREIALIATRVEDETAVLDLLEQDIEFAQGFLFGEPRLSREDPAGD